MENGDSKKTIREQVLEKIKSGRVAMKPRWHFILRTALMITGGIMALLVLLYLASLVLFVLRRTGVWFVPIFGSRGWFEFFSSLPWLLVLASLVFIVILEILVRHYKFAYRRPLLFSAIGIILLVVAVAFLIDATRLHDRFSRFAENNRLPFARDLYHGFRVQKFRSVHSGKISGTTATGFTMESFQGEALNVVIASSTRFPLGTGFSSGDSVVVFGPEASGTIQAFGIRKVDEDFDLDNTPSHFEFPPPPFRPPSFSGRIP